MTTLENQSSLNSSDMNPVPSVDHEITSEYILTNLATALGVDTLDEAAAVALLKTGGVRFLMPEGTMAIDSSLYQVMQPLISRPPSWNGFLPILSQLKTCYELDADGQAFFNSLYSPIMTNKEPLSAHKPVTLILSGKLKPSTLTKVPRKKSSPSSKPKPFTGFTWPPAAVQAIING